MELRKKAGVIIAIDAEKVFDKVQHTLMIKTLNKLELEGNVCNLLKFVYKNPHSHHPELKKTKLSLNDQAPGTDVCSHHFCSTLC